MGSIGLVKKKVPWWGIPTGACLLLAIVFLVIGALAPGPEEDDDTRTRGPTTSSTTQPTTTAERETTTTAAPSTTEAGQSTPSADETLAAFATAGLTPPDPRDNTDGNCDGVDFLCSEWLTTDILTVIVWDTPAAADRWADAGGGLETVVVPARTTVHFQDGGTTPEYDRPAYQAVLASIGAEMPSTTTTTTEAPTTTSEAESNCVEVSQTLRDEIGIDWRGAIAAPEDNQGGPAGTTPRPRAGRG